MSLLNNTLINSNETLFVRSVASFFSSDLLHNITFSLVILLVGFALGKILGVALAKLLSSFDFDQGMKKINLGRPMLSKTVGTWLSLLIYVLTVVFALFSLNVFSVVLLGVGYFLIFLITGAFLFSFIYAVPNVLSWKFVSNHDSFKKGCFVDLGLVKGVVKKVGFVNTLLENSRSELVFVPNSFIKNKLKNKK